MYILSEHVSCFWFLAIKVLLIMIDFVHISYIEFL